MKVNNNPDLSEACIFMAERLRLLNKLTIISLEPAQFNHTFNGEILMNPVYEVLLIRLMKAILTDETIQDGKEKFAAFLKEMAGKTETEIDDYLVTVVDKVLALPAE